MLGHRPLFCLPQAHVDGRRPLSRLGNAHASTALRSLLHRFMSGDQDDFDSKNVLTVPLKVVREAALNLLAHRTWWGEARVPSVNIFDDRVEFMNPGAFPPGTGPKVS